MVDYPRARGELCPFSYAGTALELGHDVQIECLRHTESSLPSHVASQLRQLYRAGQEHAAGLFASGVLVRRWTEQSSPGRPLSLDGPRALEDVNDCVSSVYLSAFPPRSFLARRTLTQSFQGTTFSSGDSEF